MIEGSKLISLLCCDVAGLATDADGCCCFVCFCCMARATSLCDCCWICKFEICVELKPNTVDKKYDGGCKKSHFTSIGRMLWSYNIASLPAYTDLARIGAEASFRALDDTACVNPCCGCCVDCNSNKVSTALSKLPSHCSISTRRSTSRSININIDCNESNAWSTFTFCCAGCCGWDCARRIARACCDAATPRAGRSVPIL
mmetsp:Transcript_53132/g.88065  ORF Transcript_53132/g.88065 Transcript_53132/m.88065 type:complete len:201 (-) Transcript_53132:95-697(-)